MNPIQLASHTEQMEAHRREFNLWFDTKILPHIQFFTFKQEVELRIHCWKLWKLSKGINT